MSRQSFELRPFDPDEHTGRISISGSICRKSSSLLLNCGISGCLSDLHIPDAPEAPERKDGLWKDTCLELFVSPSERERYWEINLSPSGHWNVYRFNSYRTGMQTEQAAENIHLNIRHMKDTVTVSTEICIDKLVPVDHAIDVAISAVIRHKDGALSFWALRHFGLKPDFHNRQGFIIRL